MSIASVSGSSNLYQYLQSLNSASSTGSTAPQTVEAANTVGSDTTQSTTNTSSSQGATGSNSGTPTLVQQLETAIQNAVNGVSSTQSNDPQAVLSSVEQAIQTTLQQNGINPSQVSQAGGHHHHGHHGGGKSGSAGGLLAALGTSATGSSTSSGDTSTSGAPTQTSQTPGLDSLLSQLNIDPQQFKNDVISALSSSQNGNINQSQVFQSFPTGQNLNTLA